MFFYIITNSDTIKNAGSYNWSNTDVSISAAIYKYHALNHTQTIFNNNYFTTKY